MRTPMSIEVLLAVLLFSGCWFVPEAPQADGGVEAEAACTPGLDQTCNDSPIVSSLMGRCEPDGTCTCYAGTALNPATGRCGSRD